jgi:hypothetical protein
MSRRAHTPSGVFAGLKKDKVLDETKIKAIINRYPGRTFCTNGNELKIINVDMFFFFTNNKKIEGLYFLCEYNFNNKHSNHNLNELNELVKKEINQYYWLNTYFRFTNEVHRFNMLPKQRKTLEVCFERIKLIEEWVKDTNNLVQMKIVNPYSVELKRRMVQGLAVCNIFPSVMKFHNRNKNVHGEIKDIRGFLSKFFDLPV